MKSTPLYVRIVVLCSLAMSSQGCVYFQTGVSPLGGAYARIGIDYSDTKEWASDQNINLPDPIKWLKEKQNP